MAAAAPDQNPTVAEVAGHSGGVGQGTVPGGVLAGSGLAAATGGVATGGGVAAATGRVVAGAGLAAETAGFSAARGRIAGGGRGGVGQIARASGAPGTATAAGAATSGSPASHFATQVGQPDMAHIVHAQAVRLALPQPIREFTESPGRRAGVGYRSFDQQRCGGS